MRITPQAKVVFIVGCIFCAGALIGASAGRYVIRSLVDRQRFDPRVLRNDYMKRFETQLGLTPEQREKISPIVDQAAHDLTQVRRNSIERSNALIRAMHHELAEVLPEDRMRILLDAEHASDVRSK